MAKLYNFENKRIRVDTSPFREKELSGLSIREEVVQAMMALTSVQHLDIILRPKKNTIDFTGGQVNPDGTLMASSQTITSQDSIGIDYLNRLQEMKLRIEIPISDGNPAIRKTINSGISGAFNEGNYLKNMTFPNNQPLIIFDQTARIISNSATIGLTYKMMADYASSGQIPPNSFIFLLGITGWNLVKMNLAGLRNGSQRIPSLFPSYSPSAIRLDHFALTQMLALVPTVY